MKNLKFLILSFMVFGFVGGVARSQNDQLRKDIDSHLADLRQAKGGLVSAQADLASAKQVLAAEEQGTPDPVGEQALWVRSDKDRSDIETYTTRMLGDITFLQNQWTRLSEGERDLVKKAGQSLQ